MLRIPELFVASRAPDLPEPAPVLRRRRIVSAATLVCGSALLAGTLSAPRGSAWFFAFGALAAATWLLGGISAGPLRWGHRGGVAANPPPVLAPVLAAVGAFTLFLAADLVVRHLPVLSGALGTVLAAADAGPRLAVLALALVNGLAEEVFFRGALYGALDARRAGLYSTLVYAAVTLATMNITLVLAALVMGTLWSVERRSTRGILAPILTHTTWSALMLLALPR